MATVKVDTANFQKEVLNSAEPVVVDFWAEWCGPCKMIAPSLEEIATELAGKVKVVKLNIDENPSSRRNTGSARSRRLPCSRAAKSPTSRSAPHRRRRSARGFRTRWLEPPGLEIDNAKPGLAGLFLFG